MPFAALDMPPGGALFAHAAALVIAAVAAVTDTRTGRIPNALTFGALGAAPVAHGLAHGLDGLVASVLGLLACAVVPLVMFRLRAMAGGDVKLFAALGAILGAFLGLEAQMYSVFAAALLSLARLAVDGQLGATLARTFYLLANPVLPKRWRKRPPRQALAKVRLGLSIFVGTAVAVALEHPLS